MMLWKAEREEEKEECREAVLGRACVCIHEQACAGGRSRRVSAGRWGGKITGFCKPS